MPPTSAAPDTAYRSMADDLAAALDPVVFARRAGFEPDDWQADVLRSTHPRMLLNCSRQSGKSTTTAIIALHQAVYVPGSLVLLLSPGLRQSSELFRKRSRKPTRRSGRRCPVPRRRRSSSNWRTNRGSSACRHRSDGARLFGAGPAHRR
ncbi:MAG: hypothetical protein M3457_02705 [Chloroflexota bacterium]|nr:hypothetical protein [Chloroflexota bacterium]